MVVATTMLASCLIAVAVKDKVCVYEHMNSCMPTQTLACHMYFIQ